MKESQVLIQKALTGESLPRDLREGEEILKWLYQFKWCHKNKSNQKNMENQL